MAVWCPRGHVCGHVAPVRECGGRGYLHLAILAPAAIIIPPQEAALLIRLEPGPRGIQLHPTGRPRVHEPSSEAIAAELACPMLRARGIPTPIPFVLSWMKQAAGGRADLHPPRGAGRGMISSWRRGAAVKIPKGGDDRENLAPVWLQKPNGRVGG